MGGAGIERLVKTGNKPLAVIFGIGCLLAQKICLCCPGVRVAHVKNYKFYVAVIKSINNRAYAAVGAGGSNVVAETAVVVVALCGSNKVAAEKGLPGTGIYTAVFKKHFPLPFITRGVCHITGNIGKSQIITAVQQREHGSSSFGVSCKANLCVG